ncbi:MAG: ABC transporter permease [Solirubrobacteraceae bacterium]|nr:ABC transporter permease [Solirubrobacteraceae bacterium]
MSAWETIRLVAAREVRVRAASRATRIGTLVLVLAIVALVVVIALVSGSGSAAKVAFTPPTGALAQPLAVSAGLLGQEVETSTAADEAAGERQVRDGAVDALVAGTAQEPRIVVDEELGDTLRAALLAVARQQALDRAVQALGGDPAAVNRDVDAVRLEVVALDPHDPEHDERLVVGTIVGVLIYVALLTYGPIVAQGVVEEKTSRVVELLLSTIRAWQLMAGKVLGIGLVGLVQFVLLIAAGVIAGVATGVLTLPASVAAGTIAWAVAWYLLGYAVYALLFAAAGALVSRQEDVSSATLPLIMVIIVPYVIGISVLPGDPGNRLVAILSLVPLFAPTLMPIREAMGEAAAWELVLATGLTLATIALLVRGAGRVYVNAVLRTGARVRLREALGRA